MCASLSHSYESNVYENSDGRSDVEGSPESLLPNDSQTEISMPLDGQVSGKKRVAEDDSENPPLKKRKRKMCPNHPDRIYDSCCNRRPVARCAAHGTIKANCTLCNPNVRQCSKHPEYRSDRCKLCRPDLITYRKCIHGKKEYWCKLCGGTGTCPHKADKTKCAICNPNLKVLSIEEKKQKNDFCATCGNGLSLALKKKARETGIRICKSCTDEKIIRERILQELERKRTR